MIKRFIAAISMMMVASTTILADDKTEKTITETISENVNAIALPFKEFLDSTIFYSIDTGFKYYSYTADQGFVATNDPVMFPIVVIWLIGAGIFFSFYLNFINIRGFKHSIKIVKGTYDDPNDPGEVTHFQALTAAVSGTVGLGNIAGVALAISLGGPGAVFWMILAGFMGMSTKFAECTLGVKYREIDENGSVTGGPMMYLNKGLANRGWPKMGKFLAIFAAVMCIGGAYGAGAMFQVNQSSAQFTNEIVALTGGDASFFAGKPWIFGIIFLTLVGMVIIGGIRQITHVTEFLVPIMAIIYVTASLFIIVSHFGDIPSAFGLIISSAFTPEAGMGGIIGALVQGLRRASFSNEAGLGSASIAHAAAKTKEPVAEGMVALLEPFIDTVVICTITALVIILTGSYGTGSGIELTSNAFATYADWFPYILTVAVIL